MDNSPLPIKERMAAKAKEVLEFYHSLSRMINTTESHDLMNSIILKSNPDYVPADKISKAVANAEEEALIELKEGHKQREIDAVRAEADRLAKEAELKQEELRIKQEAKIKALKIETDRIEAEKVKQETLKKARLAEIKSLEAKKKKLLEEKASINGKVPEV